MTGPEHRRKRFRVISNGLDIDTKLTDMKGNTIFVIPAGITGEFVEDNKKVDWYPNRTGHEKNLGKIAMIIVQDRFNQKITTEQITDKIVEEINKA